MTLFACLHLITVTLTVSKGAHHVSKTEAQSIVSCREWKVCTNGLHALSQCIFFFFDLLSTILKGFNFLAVKRATERAFKIDQGL